MCTQKRSGPFKDASAAGWAELCTVVISSLSVKSRHSSSDIARRISLFMLFEWIVFGKLRSLTAVLCYRAAWRQVKTNLCALTVGTSESVCIWTCCNLLLGVVRTQDHRMKVFWRAFGAIDIALPRGLLAITQYRSRKSWQIIIWSLKLRCREFAWWVHCWYSIVTFFLKPRSVLRQIFELQIVY